ncbi:Ligand-Gated ion Channel [Caenorhabditis elegans]|uniref:Ligand-Gated ion Channel n=1 Tax=Caenorhabditis elegans TaxID=6239 RepID=A0A8S4SRX7_CAEEL|nr:Ligand-Gated ion Channel [Caenorhabditis elegans]CAH2694482.1 Ligand-Gated ion Channel [Caenorhabditis elegans]
MKLHTMIRFLLSVCCIVNVFESADLAFIPLTKAFLDKLKNETLYNRFATPTQYDEYIRVHGTGVPTNVTLSMFIEGMSSFSAQTMDYHLDVYFQEEWYDHRLAHNASAPILVRDLTVFKMMWHPDVYFANARSAAFQDITDDNFLVWVYPNGRVWYDARISIVSSCNMDLWKYPLDSQECALRILSYAYPMTVLRLLWSEKEDVPAIDRNPDITMPDMSLKHIRTGYCNGTYATGEWSCMTAIFYVEREMMHHVMQTYVPTALIVVISWFNFWLEIDSAPARVSLSITTLLTISTQANAVKLALPEVSYMKAIDVWMGSCMAFVFGVMIEFTICHYAKNLEMLRGDGQPSLIVDTALSTLFGAARDIDDLNEEEGVRGDGEQHIALNMLNPEEPRLRSLNQNNDVTANGTRYFVGAERMKRKRSKASLSRLRQQVASMRHATIDVSRRAFNWTRALRNLRGRRVAQRIDERCRIVFPMIFLLFNVAYWSFYLVFN